MSPMTSHLAWESLKRVPKIANQFALDKVLKKDMW